MNKPMLQLKNVDVVYHRVIHVLRSVSLDLQEAQIVALLGGNGAGKTTTLKAISSLLSVEQGRVEQGEILYKGSNIANTDPGAAVANGIVQVLEGRRVLKHLSIEQNLLIGAHMRSDRDEVMRDLAWLYGTFPKLADMRARTAGYLSGGEMQMLLLSRALMAQPRVLLLDEPSMGLAPLIVVQLFRFLERVRGEKGISILLVEQNAHAALGIADRGYVLESGRIVLQGDKRDLEKNEDVREFYLGLSVQNERRSFRNVKHYKRRKRWLG